MSQRPALQDLKATPELAALLARLRRRLVLQIWLHGLGGVLVPLVLWLVFVFFADWALHVPLGVRWFHLVVLVALPVALLWHEVLRHLRRVPDATGLALLVERAHPELHELFVSAVQLQGAGPAAGEPELIARVLRDAELKARSIGLEGVLHERPQQVRALAGVASFALLLVGARLGGETTTIFLERLIGRDVPWPQRTTLELAYTDPSSPGEPRTTGEAATLRIARGTDVAISVRAIGETPEEVVLHFKGGSEAVLAPAADGTFRTVLRSCQEPIEFYATGGDDEDELPRLSIDVLDPPDIAALGLEITPPAYTGAPARVEFDRDVQVLAGSRIAITILPTPADATGSVNLQPSDRDIELAARTFPARPGETTAPLTGLGFELEVTSALRYRFKLRDSTGLSDPDPGLFSIDVVTDERPEVELVAPARLDVETVAGGLFRIGARASDDFGVTALEWRPRTMGAEQRNGEWTAFATEPAPRPMRGDEAPRGVALFGSARIEVASLSAQVQVGDLHEFDVRALDTRPKLEGEPDPAGVGNGPTVRVRVVSDEEFLRRLQDRLSRARGDVSSFEELLRRNLQRSRDVLSALDASGEAPHPTELQSLLVGERRALGDGEALTREFSGSLESALYARIDEKAVPVLEALDAELAKVSSKGFPLEAWTRFATAQRTARALPAGIAKQLLGLFDLSLQISADDLPLAAAALDRAGRRATVAEVRAELAAALEREEQAHRRATELLDLLAEWDNFQSILSLTRDILGRQKAIRDRTAEMNGTERK